MGRVRELRGRLATMYELGGRYWRQGDAGAVVDLAEQAADVETAALPRARTAARLEAAELLADTGQERLMLAENAPMGWMDDPTRTRSFSPGLERRIAELETQEQTAAAREKARATAAAEVRQEEERIGRWRADVARGLADVADLGAYTAGMMGGNQPGDVIAAAQAAQDQQDAAEAAAIQRYGRTVLALLGPEVSSDDLTAMLEQADAGQPLVRFARERGTG